MGRDRSGWPDGARQAAARPGVVNATGIGRPTPCGRHSATRRSAAQAAGEPRHARVAQDDLCPAGLGLLVARTDDGLGACSFAAFFAAPWWHHDTACPLRSERPAGQRKEAYLLD